MAMFEDFHTTLKTLTDKLMADFGLPEQDVAKLSIQAPEPFEIACNVKKNVDAVTSSAGEFERLAAEFGLESEEDKQMFRDEMMGKWDNGI